MVYKATVVFQKAEKNVASCGGKSFTFISAWGKVKGFQEGLFLSDE